MASTYPTSLDAFTNPTATSLLTSPDHAQQHSDINDAVEALEAKVAIGNTVLGTYTAYTPTWTNLTVGNGTAISAYCQVNNFVHYYGIFILGTTSSITGVPIVSLPLTSANPFSTYNMPFGLTSYHDISAGIIYEGTMIPASATTSNFRVGRVNATDLFGANISATVPMTWVSTDRIQWNMMYRTT